AGQPGPGAARGGVGRHRAGGRRRVAPWRRSSPRVQPRPRRPARDRPRGARAPGRPRTRLRADRARTPGPDGADRVTTGVLVMAYGTPGSPERVEEYYTHIRRGRPPTPEQLTDLTTRYDAIGGTSPMAERTRAQVDALASALDAFEPDGFVTALGQKHASPFIEDGVATLVGVGVDRIVGVVLAPHFSAGSVGQYLDRARAAAVEAGVEVTAVENWHLLDELIAFQASSVRNALSTLPERT